MPKSEAREFTRAEIAADAAKPSGLPQFSRACLHSKRCKTSSQLSHPNPRALTLLDLHVPPGAV